MLGTIEVDAQPRGKRFGDPYNEDPGAICVRAHNVDLRAAIDGELDG